MSPRSAELSPRRRGAPTRRSLAQTAARVLLAVTAARCAGTQSAAQDPVAAPRAARTTDAPRLASAADAGARLDASAAAPAAVNPAWARLSPDDLRRTVTEHARARLAELAPGFDLARLADYARTPAQAPELSGRAVERLLDLAAVELSAGRPEATEQIVRVVRARARNRNSAYTANTLITEARRQRAGDDAAAQQRAIEESFRELPLERFNAATVFYQLYQRREQLDARLGLVHQTMVSPETAKDALYYTTVAPAIVANRERYLAAIAAVRAEHARGVWGPLAPRRGPDGPRTPPARAPYAFSTVDLTGARDAREVVVGVWDLGTNPELFRAQLFTNTAEQPNGRDDDGNGQADDMHGLASDGDAPNTALLYDPGRETLARYAPFLRGVMDLRAGLATTPAAQQVLELFRSVTDAAQEREQERRLDAVGEWAHGTHVAGIMLAGLPQARLAVFRSAWAGENRLYDDRGPTDAELAAEQANMNAVADFIQRHRVRVVNASLGFTREYLEEELRHESSRYRTDEEVRARARAVHARRREFWEAVFRHCPETLFVVAAGNDNHDIVEYEDVPASVAAPNVLPVGAVDRFGEWATFTNSNPERVRVFDHGVEVDSVIPSGERVPLSGTSMAAPNVANLAAKLVALDPALTPVRLIEVIVATGTPIAAPFNGRVAHEARAIARVRRERRPQRTR